MFPPPLRVPLALGPARGWVLDLSPPVSKKEALGAVEEMPESEEGLA